MIPTDRFERQLPELLTELAEPRTPAYFDDLLGLTASTRQRPAWTLLERWIPMFEIARQPVHAPPIPWRAIGILAMLVVGLAVGLLLIVGALPRVPEPFGLARNGQIAFARDGDIFVAESATGGSHVLISGPELDAGPVFSRQGTQIAFLRDAPGPGERLMVADADGSNVIEVASMLVVVTNMSWSPDGSAIALQSSVGGFPTITIASADGSDPRTLELGMAAQAPAWRPPDGRELVFRGGSSDPALYLVNADGTNLRKLELTTGEMFRKDYDYFGSTWSPDGTQLAFHAVYRLEVDTLQRYGARIRIASISPEGVVVADRKLEFDQAALCECWARWSPDGRRILFHHGYAKLGEPVIEPMVAVVDSVGGATVIQTASRDHWSPAEIDGPGTEQQDGLLEGTTGFGFEWAPDGTSILAINFREDSAWVLDPAGGSEISADLGYDRTPSWQRLAP